ncbi:heterokaryon incompatibility protein-domain-containing protein [Cladorrhinum sp. PSN259]|nr:heterokaryon incompatibility protein-domain-containing protein [Cladorrhinum sp. PSN259]
MFRWHQETCVSPNVVIDQTASTPQCRSCDSRADLDRLASKIAGLSPLPSIPPDEPLDNLGLFWPPTVRYISEQTTPAVLSRDTGQPTVSVTQSTEDTSSPTQPHMVYENTLQNDQFRVLWLSSADNIDDPVHADLEVCRDDDHPDYETTSYMWGGEDGDGSLTKPVFIGPYWDVLYQTKNCWSMLQSLRPRRGQRALWVDAICINQRNMKEREEQVAKMFKLYQSASRLVVFLGLGMIAPLSFPRAYPRRKELHRFIGEQLPNSEEVRLVDVFKNKYFTRVWVVQELVVSARCLMRVGQTEYTIDRDTTDLITKWDKIWEWESSPAPWFQKASNGLLENQQGLSSLLDALKMTWHCNCSDFRDKVFGILGIATARAWFPDTGAVFVEPNYAISAQHVFIGVFAHCLVSDRDPRVIMAAAGIEQWNQYPSWAPAWKSPAPLIPVEVDFQSQDYVQWASDWQDRVLRRCKQEFLQLGPEKHYNEDLTAVKEGNVRFLSDRLQTTLESLQLDMRQSCPECTGKVEESYPSPGGCHKCKLQVNYMRFMEIGEHRGGLKPLKSQPRLSVEESTGALLIQLTHLFRINMLPSVVGQIGSREVVCYHLSGQTTLTSTEQDTVDPDEHQVFFTTRTTGLEQLILPEKDHLFALVERDQRLVFFILRQTDTPGRFRLVARCLQVMLLDYADSRDDCYHGVFRPSVVQIHERNALKISGIQKSLKAGLWDDVWETSVYDSHRMICRLFLVLCDQVQTRDVVAAARHAWDDDQVLWEQYLNCMKVHEPRVYLDSDARHMVEMKIYYHVTEYRGSDPGTRQRIYDGNSAIPHHRDRYVRLMESLGIIEPVKERKRDLIEIVGEKSVPWAWDKTLTRRIERLDSSWGEWIGSGSGRYSWTSVKIMSPTQSHAGGRYFTLCAYKSDLLKVLRETLQRVDLLRGRLSWGDKVWCEGNSADEGGDRAGALSCPDLTLNSTLRKIPMNKDAFIFDGTAYQVEIV